MKNIKSQIWVENAIYILIAVIIMAGLLSIAYPQIDKLKDKNIMKQTLSAMNVLDDKIIKLQQAGEGNVRTVDFKISSGQLEIDAPNNTLRYILEDTRLELSEIGQEIEYENKIFIKTERFGDNFKITARKDYSNILNITYKGQEAVKTLYAGTTPYSLVLENKGSDMAAGKTNIDISA
ncbi:MAG: hypothetical protein WC438_00245 [Candidatus Pacearchaeota archaeon]